LTDSGVTTRAPVQWPPMRFSVCRVLSQPITVHSILRRRG